MMSNKYRDHLTPANLVEAENYLHYCMTYGILLDPEFLSPDLIADLFIIKCRELSKIESYKR